MRISFPVFLLLFSAKIFSQDQKIKAEILGAKPGIIVNGNTDCKIGHMNLSCVPVTCDSIFIFPGDTVQFCTDAVVDLISDTAYYIKWNFTGSSNYPVTVVDHYPISNSVCRVPTWTIPGSYNVEIFYNGWLTAYPNCDCYSQGPSHWTIRVNVGAMSAVNEGFNNTKKIIYPNPAGNNLNVDLALAGEGILEIYSILGEKVQTNIIRDGINTFSTENLYSGIYFMKIISENQTVTERVVKE